MSAPVVEHVTEEQHARAVLASLAGTHHLPIAPDGIQWVGAVPGMAVGSLTWDSPNILCVGVPTWDDVASWAAALRRIARRDDRVVVCPDGTWICDRARRVDVDGWLPGVVLAVTYRETRICPAPDSAEGGLRPASTQRSA